MLIQLVFLRKAKHTRCSTSLFLCLIGPCANASLVIVYESVGTSDHVELSVNAIVELAAFFRFFVGEVAVLANAMQRGDGLLCK